VKGIQNHCSDLSDLGSIGYGRLQTRPAEYKRVTDSRDSTSIQKPGGNLLQQQQKKNTFFFFLRITDTDNSQIKPAAKQPRSSFSSKTISPASLYQIMAYLYFFCLIQNRHFKDNYRKRSISKYNWTFPSERFLLLQCP